MDWGAHNNKDFGCGDSGLETPHGYFAVPRRSSKYTLCQALVPFQHSIYKAPTCCTCIDVLGRISAYSLFRNDGGSWLVHQLLLKIPSFHLDHIP